MLASRYLKHLKGRPFANAAWGVRCVASGPEAEYQRLIARGEITADPHQVSIIRRLQSLHSEVSGFLAGASSVRESKGSWWSWSAAPAPAPLPRGVYIHGGVGCGKTFCMDLLYDSVQQSNKRRVHFHEFMLEVHDRMHKLNMTGIGGDVLPFVASDLAKEAKLLCFDEFQVTDIADAMILQRLMTSILSSGIVVVATSNRPPDDLYYQGLQRELFLPCIALLKKQLDVLHVQSPTDYRLAASQAGHTWFIRGAPIVPAAAAAAASTTPAPLAPVHEATAAEDHHYHTSEHALAPSQSFEELYQTIIKRRRPKTVTLRTQGRNVVVPQAEPTAKVARFTFEDLCSDGQSPKGAADFIVIADNFRTVFVDEVPVLLPMRRNELRRFITFIDALYDKKVKLVVSAAAAPIDLYQPYDDSTQDSADAGAASGTPVDGAGTGRLSIKKSSAQRDEEFAFDRTLSRLIEMQGHAYLSLPWLGHASNS